MSDSSEILHSSRPFNTFDLELGTEAYLERCQVELGIFIFDIGENDRIPGIGSTTFDKVFHPEILINREKEERIAQWTKSRIFSDIFVLPERSLFTRNYESTQLPKSPQFYILLSLVRCSEFF